MLKLKKIISRTVLMIIISLQPEQQQQKIPFFVCYFFSIQLYMCVWFIAPVHGDTFSSVRFLWHFSILFFFFLRSNVSLTVTKSAQKKVQNTNKKKTTTVTAAVTAGEWQSARTTSDISLWNLLLARKTNESSSFTFFSAFFSVGVEWDSESKKIVVFCTMIA